MARQPDPLGVAESKSLSEQVDISKGAANFEVYSPGTLQELDEVNRISNHWWHRKAIVWLSGFLIAVILLGSMTILAISADETSRDWARQTISALMGFAAGAFWQIKSNGS